MRRLIRLVSTAALAAAVQPATAGILAQAVPVKYNLTAKPGETLARTVAVRNLGDTPVVVRVHWSDWTMSEDGELDLVAAGSTPATLQGLVQFEPKHFSLQPGETGVIHITARMPAEGPATLWGVMLSEVRPVQWPTTGFGPRAVAELGTTVYLSRVPAEMTRAEMTALDVRAASDSTLAVAVRVKNPGERHLYSSGDLAVRDSTGAVVSQGKLATGVVLPHSLRSFTWTCASRLLPGRYTVTATLDCGEPELIVGETEIRWPLAAPRALPVARQDD